MNKSRHLRTVRDALTELLNERGITDRERLRCLESLDRDIRSFAGELRSRMPDEPAREKKDPDGGLCRM